MKDRVVLVLVVLCLVVLNVAPVASGAESPLGELSIVDDLDGDGGEDLLSIRSRPADPLALGENTVEEVSALSGSDGSELWTTDLPSGFYSASPLADGGILLVGYTYTAGTAFGTNFNGYETTHGCCVSGAGSVTTYLFALNADGGIRWERTFEEGKFVYAENRAFSDQLALFRGTLNAASGSDLSIVSIYDREPTPEGQQDQVTTIVVDNSTGETQSTNLLDIDGRRTIIRRVGDLSQDGVDDYIIDTDPVGTFYVAGNHSIAGEYQLPPQEDAPRQLHAIDSVTGQELWVLSVDEGTPDGLTRVGDVVGDDAPDLALDRGGLLGESGGTETIPLIDGSSGQIVGELPGQVAIGAADANDNDKGEILTVDFIRDGVARRVSYGLYAADATLLRSESHSVEVPSDGFAQLTANFDAGDVNADGITDLSHLLVVDSPSPEDPLDERVINGLDGSTIRVGRTGTPLRASVDGDGDDFYSIAAEADSTARELTVLDGLDGDSLWTARIVPQGERTTFLYVRAADFDGDGRSDVLVRASSTTADPTVGNATLDESDYVQFFVLSGADGHLLWQG